MPYSKPIQEHHLIKQLKDMVEPLPGNTYGTGYRAAVYLVDGTYLPCVIFRNSGAIIKLAMRRFKEEKQRRGTFGMGSSSGYIKSVKSFVTAGNCINYFEISKIEISPYALPQSILSQIEGETTMGWTGFVIRMKDKSCYSFGTSLYLEFFNLPTGYVMDDIEEVINHSYVASDGTIQNYRSSDTFDTSSTNLYREKVYFECFIDGL